VSTTFSTGSAATESRSPCDMITEPLSLRVTAASLTRSRRAAAAASKLPV
jgi:hypothetical protein